LSPVTSPTRCTVRCRRRFPSIGCGTLTPHRTHTFSSGLSSCVTTSNPIGGAPIAPTPLFIQTKKAGARGSTSCARSTDFALTYNPYRTRSVSLQIFSAKNTDAPLPLAMKSDAPALTWEALTLPNSSTAANLFRRSLRIR
jgi:hypothetical protein